MMAGERLREHPSLNVQLVLRGRVTTNVREERTHNRLTVNEVAAIVVDNEHLANGLDVIVQMRPEVDPSTGWIVRGSLFQRVNPFSAAFDPLHLPLVEIDGRTGWTFEN
jgi:hypothetical protein